MAVRLSIVFVLALEAVCVLGGRAFEDTITEDHAYYTMSLYQATQLNENCWTCKTQGYKLQTYKLCQSLTINIDHSKFCHIGSLSIFEF